QAIPGGEILGGKTGYTEEAGLCLASLARKNGQEYTLVTAGAKGDHKSEQYDIDDACEVYRALGQN
ncbi:MAG TPA: D-alanyl-D-alanine carboxypeptidase, partial [Ruminococcaceae bacterium]|nr:D-alanyl-D-alanine carboxypeptidase [Oscillospiraceae bacterium]